MKIKIVVEVQSSDKQPNKYHGKFIKDENETAEFAVIESEIKKLKDMGVLEEKVVSNSKVVYVREFEI